MSGLRPIVLTAVLTAALTATPFVLFHDGSDGPAAPSAPAAAVGGQQHHGGQGAAARGGRRSGDQHGRNHVADSDAPAGAPGHWLPDERWVTKRWMPYAVSDLFRVLDTSTNEVQKHLRTAPLDALVEAKGLDRDAVLRRLMAPVRREHPRTAAELARRAERTFTQRHLLQHMLLHGGHNPAFGRAVQDELGLPWGQIHRLRRDGLSLVEMARRQRRDPDRVLDGIEASLRRGALEGVRAGQMPARQADAMLRPVLRALPRKWDRGNQVPNNPTGVGPGGDERRWTARG